MQVTLSEIYKNIMMIFLDDFEKFNKILNLAISIDNHAIVLYNYLYHYYTPKSRDCKVFYACNL